MMPLIEKYRANSLSEIKGQDSAVMQIRNFLKFFPKKRALILNGPVGTGKTTMALNLAKENNLELFELNASDLRNRKNLEEVLKPSLQQKSLFEKGKLILMDEADGITGSDRGGVPELVYLISKTPYPIIITSNDIWKKKFSLLRRKCQIVNLKELSSSVLFEMLKNIIDQEGKSINPRTIELLVKKSKGDARAALNDLQSILDFGEEDFISEISEREKQNSIFNALKRIFQSETEKDIIRVYDDTQMELDEIILWIEENIPLEYRGKALAKAYYYLSKADIFKGRIYRQQHWRFLVYENFFLTAGISSATKLKNKTFKNYNKPSRILKIWLSNQKNAKKKSVINKYSRFTHMSKKKASKENFLMPLILSELDENTIKKMDLDEKEIDYIKDKKAAIIISQGLNRFRV